MEEYNQKIWQRCLTLEAEGRARIFPRGHHQVTPCRTFEQKLQSIVDLEVLEGFANRRRVLGVDLPKWTPEEIEMIKVRKMELEVMTGGRKKRR